MYNEEISKTNENFSRYKERLTSFSSEFELGLFLYIARKSIIWIVLIILLATIGSLVYLRYEMPIYESTLILQINEDNTANKVLQVDNLYESEDLSSKIELLRSKYLMNRTLKTLPLQVGYFNKGQFLTYDLYTNCPFKVTYFIKDSSIIGKNFHVYFRDTTTFDLTYIEGGKEIIETHNIGDNIVLDKAVFNIKVLDYKKIAEEQSDVKQQEFIFRINSLNKLTDQYIKRLTVNLLSSAAKTIAISFKDNNPKQARDIVTALAAEYDKYDLERKGKSSNQVLNFIDNQLDIVYKRLRKQEESIKKFRKTNLISADESISNMFLEDLTRMQQDIAAYDLELSILEEIDNSITRSPEGEEAYNMLPILVGTEFETTLSTLISLMHQLVIQKQKALYEVTPDNESIKSLNYQIKIQKELIKTSIKELRLKIETKKNKIKEKSTSLEGKFATVPEKEIEYAQMRRLYTMDEKFFTLLLEKQTEYSISEAGFVPHNIVLEKASTPKDPVSPNYQLSIMAFLLGGVSLSLALVIVRYLSHNEITSLNEITKHTQASIGILGIVPKYRKEIPQSQLIIDQNPKSMLAESFRTIRSNLEFISSKEGAKVMAITSTISGEGKTFIALNLGGIIAFSGKKVIILDLDMRKPKIHSGFGVANDNGMSTLLINKDEISNCIHKSKLDNLDFITAGPIPPNPSELIINGKLEGIIDQLKKSYDVIIIDNPPVGLVTDGISIIKQADYPIYIFRAEYSKKNFIQNVDRLYNENKFTKLSIVLNGIDINKHNYGYNYGYGYGYGYGYTYGGTYGGYYDEQHTRKRSKKRSKKLFKSRT